MNDDLRLRMGNGDAVLGRNAFVSAVEAFNAPVVSVRHDLLTVWAMEPPP